MAEQFEIAILVGSLRRESFSRKVANALIGVAPARLRCRIVEIGDLPMYNEDLDAPDAQPPHAWTRLRAEIEASQGVLFVTPEYNRSIPACLKNAVDVASRPGGKNLLDGLPGGVVSVTPYQLGAFGANHALRQTFVFLNVAVMQQPEAYVGNAAKLFDDKGQLKSHETREFLRKFMTSYQAWVEKVGGGKKAPPTDLDAFMRRRDEIARAYTNGDAAPLDEIVARRGPATFFPPKGGFEQGAQAVAARYDRDAKSFKPGNQSRLEVLQSGSDVAFWSGFQEAKVLFAGQDQPVEMKLRITEVFRRIDGEWRLAHRHADGMAEETKSPEN